jgi:DNA-binding transcriptional regulator YiaG
MSVFKSIMEGLTETTEYQHDKIPSRKMKLTIKPVSSFNIDDIKQIRQKTLLRQVIFTFLLSVSPKTVESCENSRNKQEGAFHRLLEIVRDYLCF